MNDGSKRLEYIDFLKGIGILLVVFGHMHYTTYFHKLIYGFHMPLFFIISGYLYRRPEKEKVLAYIKKKTKSLLLPYYSFGIIYSFAALCSSGKETFIIALRGVLVETTVNIPYETSLWFLMCLWCTCLLYLLLDIYISNCFIKTFIIVVISSVGCIWVRYFSSLPWALNVSFSALGFYSLGVLLRNFNEKQPPVCTKQYGGLILLIALVGVGILIILNGKVNMRTGEYAMFPLSYFYAAAFSTLFLLLVKNYIVQIKKYNVCNSLIRIGHYSIIYLCINHPAITVVRKVFVYFGIILGSTFEVIFEFVCIILLLEIISAIIRSTKLRILFSIRT